MSLVYLRKKSNFNQKKPEAFSNLRVVKDQILVDIEYSAQAANGNNGKSAVCNVVSEAIPELFRHRFRVLALEAIQRTSADKLETLRRFYVEIGYPDSDLQPEIAQADSNRRSLNSVERTHRDGISATSWSQKRRGSVEAEGSAHLRDVQGGASRRRGFVLASDADEEAAECLLSVAESSTASTSVASFEISSNRRKPGRPPKQGCGGQKLPDAIYAYTSDFSNAEQPRSVSQQVLPLRFRRRPILDESHTVDTQDILDAERFKERDYKLATPLQLVEKCRVKRRKRSISGTLVGLPKPEPLPELDRATIQSIVTPPASPATFSNDIPKKHLLRTPGQLDLAASSKSNAKTLGTPPASPLNLSPTRLTRVKKRDHILSQISDQRWLISHIENAQRQMRDRLVSLKAAVAHNPAVLDAVEGRKVLYAHRKRLHVEKLRKLQDSLVSLYSEQPDSGSDNQAEVNDEAGVEHFDDYGSDTCDVIDRELDLLSQIEQRASVTANGATQSEQLAEETLDSEAMEAADILVRACSKEVQELTPVETSVCQLPSKEGSYEEMVSLVQNLVDDVFKSGEVASVQTVEASADLSRSKLVKKPVRVRKRVSVSSGGRRLDRAAKSKGSSVMGQRLPSITESGTFLREMLNDAVPSMSQLTAISGAQAVLAPHFQSANILGNVAYGQPQYSMYTTPTPNLYDNYVMGYQNQLYFSGYNDYVNHPFYGSQVHAASAGGLPYGVSTHVGPVGPQSSLTPASSASMTNANSQQSQQAAWI